MSLLLDALKRAEQEKLARGPGPADTGRGGQTVRERQAANSASLELQPLSSAAAAGASLGAARSEPGVYAAQSVFQAKSAGPAAERGRGMVWATIGAVVVVAIAAGSYVWYSVKSLTPSNAVVQRPRPAPIAVQGGGPPPPPDTAVLAAAGAPVLDPPPRALANPGVPPAAATAPPAASLPPAAEPRPRVDPIAGVLRDSASAADAPVRLDRTAGEQPRRVPADISAGYDALRQGNLPGARRSYGAALTQDPANLDAVLGMATIEARTGNRPAAALQYRRALELDPRNATALAGMAALADFSRPEAIEAQLRSDLLRFPESSALHFTLGNVYSAQSRWTEAQAEYFEAHRLDPGSADVMFNLAVAMDHLGQARLAAAFYRRALESAPGQSAQFDTHAVARRLAEIH